MNLLSVLLLALLCWRSYRLHAIDMYPVGQTSAGYGVHDAIVGQSFRPVELPLIKMVTNARE